MPALPAAVMRRGIRQTDGPQQQHPAPLSWLAGRAEPQQTTAPARTPCECNISSIEGWLSCVAAAAQLCSAALNEERKEGKPPAAPGAQCRGQRSGGAFALAVRRCFCLSLG